MLQMELESIVVVNDDQPEQRQEENRVNSDQAGGENEIDEFIPVAERYPDIPMRLDGERVSKLEVPTYLFTHMRVFLIFIFLYRFPEHARSNCGPETGKKVNLINSNSEALVKVIVKAFVK